MRVRPIIEYRIDHPAVHWYICT